MLSVSDLAVPVLNDNKKYQALNTLGTCIMTEKYKWPLSIVLSSKRARQSDLLPQKFLSSYFLEFL